MKAAAVIFGLIIAIVAAAGHATARPALKDVNEIAEGLIVVGMAYEISERCDSIDARLLRGIAALNALKTRAQQLGYSEAEIEAYTDSKAEQDRLEAIARARLVELGAKMDDPASFCAVGAAQIAAQNAVGRLLR